MIERVNKKIIPFKIKNPNYGWGDNSEYLEGYVAIKNLKNYAKNLSTNDNKIMVYLYKHASKMIQFDYIIENHNVKKYVKKHFPELLI